MFKRKTISGFESIEKNLISKLFDNKCYLEQCVLYDIYNDESTCNKIKLLDNHVYFNAIICDKTINKLMEFIQNITQSFEFNKKKFVNNEYDNHKTIYLHINSKGGNLKSILPFIAFKNEFNIEITSIIQRECNDAAILLASICDYRIIKKNATCKLSSYTDKNLHNNLPYFWDYFKQCNNDTGEIIEFKNTLYSLFCNTIDSKITIDKLNIYLNQNNNWNSKKYKKLGLADEII